MAPKIDPAVIEASISNYFTRDDILEALVSKLTLKLKAVVKEAVTTALQAVTEEVRTLRGEVSSLNDKVEELEQQLGLRIDDMEQYQRRNNLRVFGVPETSNEDTDTKVLKLFKDKLKVDLPIDVIGRSHRVGRQTRPGQDGETRPRPIIVQFTSYRHRRRIFQSKKLLKDTGAAVREDLTAYRLKVYRKAAEKFGLRSTWTSDGRIMWITGEGNNRKFHSATRLDEVKE